MSATIFSIANQKGGVGKTTTAINLATGLAKRGISTLLIDLDPQGNATSGLGFEKKEGGSLYRILHDGGDVEALVIQTRQKHLKMIPSELDLAAMEIELAQKENYLGQLKQCLVPIKESEAYRAVVIDCPPALGLISMNSLVAADYLLIALQCEYLAMEGLSQILRVVEKLKESGVSSRLNLGGIIMTLFDNRTNLSRQIVQEVHEHFPQLVFKTRIPRSVRLSEAPSFGKSIFEYDEKGPGAVAYDELSREVIRRFSLKK